MLLLMEIVNLDDSIEVTPDGDEPSIKGDINKDVNLQNSKKRKKRLSPKLKKLNRLLLKKNEEFRSSVKLDEANNICTELNDPDITLNPDLDSSPCLNESRNRSRAKKRRKTQKQRSSKVVVLDSEDDCILMENSEDKVNNNGEESVLCISESSVIEVSSSSDEEVEQTVGIVTGLVESSNNAPKRIPLIINNANSQWGLLKQRSFNERKRNESRNVFELTERLGRYFPIDSLEERKNSENNSLPAANMRIMNGAIGNKRTEQFNQLKQKTSRQSISYKPLDSTSAVQEGPRPIIIDGCNVAFGHGKERFSARGIQICIDYFIRRKHTEIHAFVPQFRRRHPSTVDIHILDKLEKEGYLVYTPSRKVDGKRITSYDDRFIVEYAAKTGGIIITRDNYQDLLAENNAWSDTINFRLLQYTFVGDMIMFPHDPLGRGGPTLDKFLLF